MSDPQSGVSRISLPSIRATITRAANRTRARPPITLSYAIFFVTAHDQQTGPASRAGGESSCYIELL